MHGFKYNIVKSFKVCKVYIGTLQNPAGRGELKTMSTYSKLKTNYSFNYKNKINIKSWFLMGYLRRLHHIFQQTFIILFKVWICIVWAQQLILLFVQNNCTNLTIEFI